MQDNEPGSRKSFVFSQSPIRLVASRCCRLSCVVSHNFQRRCDWLSHPYVISGCAWDEVSTV